MAEVKLNWNSTEQSPQNLIGAPDQLYSELWIATERALRYLVLSGRQAGAIAN